MAAWHLVAPVYLNGIPETGFHTSALGPALSEFGAGHVPALANPAEVTRDPYFTDLSEILALEVLGETEPDLVIPFARVYHKEADGLQHHGIDTLGYTNDGSGDYTLFVIEAMASNEHDHPPGTVRAHRRQLLDQTLNEPSLDRLRRDLSYVHAEAEDKHKPVLNGFIATLIRDRKLLAGGVVATSVLVRPVGMLSNLDDKPFRDSTAEFEAARVPSRILFKGIDCGLGFVELFTTVVASLQPGAAGA